MRLHIKPLVYQTLPLYANLRTKGTYITACDFDFVRGEATVCVDAEVRNESATAQQVTLEVAVLDGEGCVHASFTAASLVPAAKDAEKAWLTVVPPDAYSEKPAPLSLSTPEVVHIAVCGRARSLQFWSPDTPQLYTVRTTVRTASGTADTVETVTGFREVTYDVHAGGVQINGKPFYLCGYGIKGWSYDVDDEGYIVDLTNDDISMGKAYGALDQALVFIPHTLPQVKPAQRQTERKIKELAVIEANRQYAVMNSALVYLSNSPAYALEGAMPDQILSDARTQYICGRIDEAGLQTAFDKWEKVGVNVVKEVNAQYKANK